jgi:drug/metabolite transporter (DMT)-like permease
MLPEKQVTGQNKNQGGPKAPLFSRESFMTVYLKLLAASFFWGGTYIAGRIVALTGPPLVSAFIRYFMASLLLLLILRLREGFLPTLPRKQIFPVVILGATGIFAYNILFFIGMSKVEAGRAAVIVASNPLFIALLAAWFFREKLSPRRLAGVVFSLAGAALVIFRGSLDDFAFQVSTGEVLLLGCTLSWTIYSLLGRQVMQELSPLTAVAYSSVFGTIALLPPAVGEILITGQFPIARDAWISLVYLALFGTVVSFFWYYEGIKAIGPTRASVFINFVPLAALFLSWLILAEPIGYYLITGALLVTTGAWLVNKQTGKAM